MGKFFLNLFAFILLLSYPVSGYADTEMAIYDTSDQLIFRCILEDQPTINITDAGLEIKSKAMETLLALTDFSSIGKIEFHDGTQAGVSSAVADAFSFRFVDGNTVSVSGINRSDAIQVISLNGQRQNAYTVRTDHSAVIDLSALPLGVYLIHVGQQSFKIYKR